MTRYALALAAMITFCVAAAPRATGQGLAGVPMACGPRDDLLGQLKKRHHESMGGWGIGKVISGRQVVYELFANRLSGTFTILQTRPSGISCILAHGTNWQQIKLQNPIYGSIM